MKMQSISAYSPSVIPSTKRAESDPQPKQTSVSFGRDEFHAPKAPHSAGGLKHFVKSMALVLGLGLPTLGLAGCNGIADDVIEPKTHCAIPLKPDNGTLKEGEASGVIGSRPCGNIILGDSTEEVQHPAIPLNTEPRDVAPHYAGKSPVVAPETGTRVKKSGASVVIKQRAAAAAGAEEKATAEMIKVTNFIKFIFDQCGELGKKCL